MALSCFLSAIKGRQGACLQRGRCKGRGMLCVSQPFGTLSYWGLQKADQELKACNFQQADWDWRLFSSRCAVVWNKGVRGGGNLVDAACAVSDQVSLSQLRGQTQRETQDVRKGKGDCVIWGSALGASHPHSCAWCSPFLFSRYFLQVLGGGTALL